MPKRNIKTINAACLSQPRGIDEEESETNAKEFLCVDLAKEMFPYVTFEKYKMVGKHWEKAIKYIATIKIIEE